MQLAVLPEATEPLIVCGTSVRKPLIVLKEYLASLEWQELPKRVRVHYVFVADFTKEQADAEQYLREWTKERGGEMLRGGPQASADFSDASGLVTHQWSVNAFHRVAENKNKILRRVVELKADAVWLADSDLIMDRTTLRSLWATEKPVACAIYWTHWVKQTKETVPSYAMPQVWLRHPYGLDGRGMEQWEFRAKLVNRELTRVWGQGACTLIRTPVIVAGVSFAAIPEGLPPGPMSDGEDRHFCARADRLHVDMWADCWPDVFHIYHLPDDLQRIPVMRERLSMAHPTRAQIGHLVSLRLDALEPFPQPNGQWYRVPPQFLRGRLGAMPLLPELEEAVLNLDRGQERMLPVHVPIHYPIAYMRGKRRLIRVELLDCKEWCYAPVLESEMMGKIDRTSLTPRQLEAITP